MIEKNIVILERKVLNRENKKIFFLNFICPDDSFPVFFQFFTNSG